jgi:hypothetical protein
MQASYGSRGMAYSFLVSKDGKAALQSEQQQFKDLLYVAAPQLYKSQLDFVYTGMAHAVATYEFVHW